jgi:myo-inositol 2-dehydrogenase / D-chiro-inositol 1-dehydrogenase
VKLGLVGAGRWAEVHRRALQAEGAGLAGVLVSSEASKRRVEREWAVRVTTSQEAFFALDMDAVIIASPNYLHAPHAVAALAAGKHVLVEKPMATRLEDCERMLEAADGAGKVLAVGLEMRVFTLFSKVKEVLDSGEIGLPVHLKLDLWRRPYRTGSGGWKSDPEKLGSTILEEPIHYLDLARWYLGKPLLLEAWANSRPGREHLFENLDVRLEFAGARAFVTRSIAAYGHAVSLKLVGEKGALEARWEGEMDLDPEPKVALTLHTDEGTRAVEVPRRTGHAYDLPKQTRAFLEAILAGKKPPADGADGRASVALCLAVEASLKQGGEVALTEE